MNETKEETKYEPFKNSKMVAFKLGTMIGGLLWGLRAMFQLYATKGLGLTLLTVFIIYAIYTAWDAINDPLTGFLLDRSKKLTSKRGKRFPFIVIGMLGAIFLLIMLFVPISNDPIIASIYLLVMLIVWDQFQTLYELSFLGLESDIFRDNKQRVKAGAIGTVLDNIGSVLKSVLIPLVLSMFGGESSAIAYTFMTITISAFLLVLVIPHFLAVREPKEMVEFRTDLDNQGKSTSSFTDIMKRTLKDRNWVGLILLIVTWVAAISCITIGVYNYVVDGLGQSLDIVTIVSLLYLIAGFLSIPMWMRITKKVGARKAYMYAMGVLVSSGIIFTIVAWTVEGMLAVVWMPGIGAAGHGVIFVSLYSETIENSVVQSGKREEASYMGVLRFFTAMSTLVQLLIFLIVATATGYDPSIDYWSTPALTPSLPVIIGLNIQMALIPQLMVTIAGIIFLKLNKVTKEVAIANKKKIIEMGL